jgi:nucleotide-binding universal stress UspA family protein
MRSFLLPLDGSSVARQILPFLGRLLGRPDLRIDLLGVVPEPSYVDSVWEDYAQRRLDLHAELEAARTALEGDGRRIVVHLETGNAADHILALQERLRPSLTALMRHVETETGPRGLGGTAGRVLRHARDPILLLRPVMPHPGDEPGPGQYRRVLFPVDPSATATRLPELLIELASLYDAQLYFQVLLPGAPGGETGNEPIVLRRLTESIRRAGRSVFVRRRSGAPGRQVLEAVEECRIDLVAVAPEGGHAPYRWPPGPVDEEVMTSCPVDLLYCPLPGTPANLERDPHRIPSPNPGVDHRP